MPLRTIAFCVLLCMRQSEANRYFMIENPVGASSWSMQLAGLFTNCPNTRRVNLDFCMLGMTSKDKFGASPAKNGTSVVTNSEELAKTLGQHQCDSLRRHVTLEGGRAKACEKYPDMFCEKVLKAVQRVIENDNSSRTPSRSMRTDISQLTRAETTDVTK